jgi:hypothetical protein
VGGFRKLQRAGYFESITWNSLSTMTSPLKPICDAALDELMRGGLDKEVVSAFSAPYRANGWDNDVEF